MNEQINQLAEQAQEYAAEYEFANGGDDFEIFKEKFAELIIRECAKVAKRNTPDLEELDYSHLISDKIKQHFGVE